MTTPQLKTPVQQNSESEMPQSIREEDLAELIQTTPTTASAEPNLHTTTCTVSTGSRPPSLSGGVPSRLLTRLRGGSVSSSTAPVTQDRDSLTENGVLAGATDVEPTPQQLQFQQQQQQQQQQRSSRPNSISISSGFLGRLRAGSTSSALQPPPSPTVLVTETTRVTSVEILPTGTSSNANATGSGSGNNAGTLGRRTPSPVGAAAAAEASSRRNSTLPPVFTLPFTSSEPFTFSNIVASNDYTYTPITVPGADPDSSPPDFIEQLFQRVEAESERRAAAEEARERERERAAQGSRSASRPGTADPGAPRIGVNRRRGGSISVSRLGAPIDPSASEGSVPATPSRLSTIILQNPLYQHHQANTSKDTISSTSSSHHAEEPTTHVTQITTIPARSRSATLSKVVNTAIGRRLSRARSTDILTVDGVGSDGIDIVVVGVSVQSAVQTVSVVVEPSPDERDELALSPTKEEEELGLEQGFKNTIVAATVFTAEVSAPGQLQPKPRLRRSQSKLGLLATKGWGTLTKRFKKKSGDLQSAPASPPTPAAVS